MALKTKLIEYKIKNEDICCAEQFINITIENKGGFTTEEVHNRPIVADNGTGKVIGMLLEADEDNLYGYVYSLSSIYDRKDIDVSLVVSRECVE